MIDEGLDYCGLVNTIHKVIFLATSEKLVNEWPVGSHIVMNSTPRVPGNRPLMAIGYKYNSRKFLEFISTEGYGSTEPCDPYSSFFPDNYFNVYIPPTVLPCVLGRYFNSCNGIDNHNRMHQYELALDKYRVKQSDYFRLAPTLALGMGITGLNILLCHGILE